MFNDIRRIAILAPFLLFGVGLIELVLGSIGEWKYLYYSGVLLVWFQWDYEQGIKESFGA